ncbi:MAG: hypothetical protein ACKERF_01670 [Candidatus Hodgkinia cicadicola]
MSYGHRWKWIKMTFVASLVLSVTSSSGYNLHKRWNINQTVRNNI